MKFLFAGILAFCISCVFSIEIDQNIETDSDQPGNQEDSDVSFGKYNIKVNWVQFKIIATYIDGQNYILLDAYFD